MSYELHVHATSPVRPTVRELLAQAAESGLAVELAAPASDTGWDRLTLRSPEDPETRFSIAVSDRLAETKAAFSELAGDDADDLPVELADARCLYVVEVDDAGQASEPNQAAFVVTAWGLAVLTGGIVFDPQEHFLADADSFWGLIMDEEAGDEVEVEDDGDAEAEAAASPRLVVLPSGPGCCDGARGTAGSDHVRKQEET